MRRILQRGKSHLRICGDDVRHCRSISHIVDGNPIIAPIRQRTRGQDDGLFVGIQRRTRHWQAVRENIICHIRRAGCLHTFGIRDLHVRAADIENTRDDWRNRVRQNRQHNVRTDRGINYVRDGVGQRDRKNCTVVCRKWRDELIRRVRRTNDR